MIDYGRQNKTYRYGDKKLPKVDNKGIRTGWIQCPKPLNNDVRQVFVQTKTRNDDVPIIKKLFKFTNKAPVQGIKLSSATNKVTRTTLRRCSRSFIANLKRPPVQHSSTSNRQMLEMLTLHKGSETYPKLIEKKLQNSTRNVAKE